MLTLVTASSRTLTPPTAAEDASSATAFAASRAAAPAAAVAGTSSEAVSMSYICEESSVSSVHDESIGAMCLLEESRRATVVL